jgi:ComF family protein
MAPVEDVEERGGAGRVWADLKALALANLRYAGDLILPPLCIACRGPIAEHGVLCPTCWQGIDFITPPVCQRLGLPLPYSEDGPSISAVALRHPPAFARARAPARFSGVMRGLIHRFKYADRHEATGFFVRLMLSAGAELIRDADLIAPVPLHPRRLWQRRYNQAAILAKQIAGASGVPCAVDLLSRKRRTPSQVGMSREERRRNVAAAFIVRPRSLPGIRGKRILLIDDVITTGSTLSACAATLEQAGAAAVDCLAIAMVAGDSPNGA